MFQCVCVLLKEIPTQYAQIKANMSEKKQFFNMFQQCTYFDGVTYIFFFTNEEPNLTTRFFSFLYGGRRKSKLVEYPNVKNSVDSKVGYRTIGVCDPYPSGPTTTVPG